MKEIIKVLKSSVVMSVFLLFAIGSILPACNVSTASLSNVQICSSLNSEGGCGSNVAEFHSSDPVIYCSASLKNAPSGTKVSFTWKHEDEVLGTANVETGSAVINSSYKSPGTLKPGKYSVTVKINTDNATPLTASFTVAE